MENAEDISLFKASEEKKKKTIWLKSCLRRESWFLIKS